MNKSVKSLTGRIAGAVALFGLVVGFAVAPSAAVYAQTSTKDNIKQGIDASGQQGGKSLFDGGNSIFKTIVNTLLFIVGALSVVMLIYGGIRYTASGGSSASIAAGKNTIIYSIIGLIVAFLAYAIVNWVLDRLA